MGIFDFLDNIGESKNKFKEVKSNSDLDTKVQYLEILQSRNLLMEDFKSNVEKSVKLHNEIELELLSVDDEEFKLKNDELEYIGVIDRIQNNSESENPNRGMVSYNFVKSLFNQLNRKNITLKEINDLSDILEFKVLKVFNVKQITPKKYK